MFPVCLLGVCQLFAFTITLFFCCAYLEEPSGITMEIGIRSKLGNVKEWQMTAQECERICEFQNALVVISSTDVLPANSR